MLDMITHKQTELLISLFNLCMNNIIKVIVVIADIATLFNNYHFVFLQMLLYLVML